MKVLNTLAILLMICSGSVFAGNCETKLIPKKHVLLVISNYQTEWEKTTATSLDECISIAEKKLKIANTPKKLETLEEILDDYWASWSNPEYFKGVQAKYTDEQGQVSRYIRFPKK
jgi:hypothetical protein